MKWTGERLVTHVDEYYTYEHLHRYYLAMDFVRDKTVLDVASGEGYGAALMSQVGRHVMGVDLNTDAVAHATNKYRSTRLQFEAADICDLPYDDGRFDVITCFETIEHVKEHDQVMRELKRVLKPNGILIISTPDLKSTHHHAGNGQNPFHLKELDSQEFDRLIEMFFVNNVILNQKTINASIIVSASNDSGGLKEYNGGFEQFKEIHPYTNAQYMIGICSDANLPHQPSDSLLTYQSSKKSIVEKILFKIINLFK